MDVTASPDLLRERSAAIAKAFADPKRLCVLERLADAGGDRLLQIARQRRGNAG